MRTLDFKPGTGQLVGLVLGQKKKKLDLTAISWAEYQTGVTGMETKFKTRKSKPLATGAAFPATTTSRAF